MALSADGGPAFLFDLGSPDAYLAAERVLAMMPVATEWIPVLAAGLPAPERHDAYRCAADRDIALNAFELAAARRGLQPLRWPEPFPFDSALAMQAATFAKSIGRTVAFALAAFRQAFAAGRALDTDTILIAAAACEMHPTALLRALERPAIGEELARRTEQAAALGVRDVPAVVVGERIFHGDAALEGAARAAA
jgi:2-hydroxychromene-2-carboxylate isomerase